MQRRASNEVLVLDSRVSNWVWRKEEDLKAESSMVGWSEEGKEDRRFRLGRASRPFPSLSRSAVRATEILSRLQHEPSSLL